MVNYCFQEPPRVLYTDDNWTHMPTSEDQKRIEAVLKNYVKPSGEWLHIGIGNSSLERLYVPHIRHLIGITVCQEEIDTAPMLTGYFPCLVDKHSPDFKALMETYPFDVVIDTTPGAHACCWKHLGDYLDAVFKNLKGVYLTDRVGLAWSRPTGRGMTPEEFKDLVEPYGMQMNSLTNYVLEIRRK